MVGLLSLHCFKPYALDRMMESLQQISDEGVQENFETTLWSPTRLDIESFRSQSANNAEFQRAQPVPVSLELQRRQVEYEAAMGPERDERSLSPGFTDQSDGGLIVASLKKALPTLLRENSLFRERVYAQSAIEPDASPMADPVHEKIIREQWQLQRSGSSPDSFDVRSNMLGHRNVLLGKTPPTSPPFKLPHFSSQSTLVAEDAPLHRRRPHKNGTRNIQILESLRQKEILADPLFALPMRTRPPLPDTASANEISFLLGTQAQRRRKQIQSERTGEVSGGVSDTCGGFANWFDRPCFPVRSAELFAAGLNMWLLAKIGTFGRHPQHIRLL